MSNRNNISRHFHINIETSATGSSTRLVHVCERRAACSKSEQWNVLECWEVFFWLWALRMEFFESLFDRLFFELRASNVLPTKDRIEEKVKTNCLLPRKKRYNCNTTNNAHKRKNATITNTNYWLCTHLTIFHRQTWMKSVEETTTICWRQMESANSAQNCCFCLISSN